MPITISNVSFNPSNFNKDNTPDGIAKVANTVLKVSAALVITGLVIAAPPLAGLVGPQVVNIALITAGTAGSVGTVVKYVSKLFGIKVDETPIPSVPTSSQNGIKP